MPQVIIKRDPERIEDELIEELVQALPEKVASALTVPGTDCEVTAADISIEVRDRGRFDKLTHDLEISVIAGQHLDRYQNRRMRERNINHTVHMIAEKYWGKLVNPRGFVWLLLCEDAFDEFPSII